MKKVGNFLIDLERQLGKGQYGKVNLAQEIPDEQAQQLVKEEGAEPTVDREILTSFHRQKDPELYAVKIVERANLCPTKEALVVSEI